MLQHAAQRHEDISEPPKFVASTALPLASLYGHLPLVWTFASTAECDRAGWTYVPQTSRLR